MKARLLIVGLLCGAGCGLYSQAQRQAILDAHITKDESWETAIERLKNKKPEPWELEQFKEWQPRWESFENLKVGMDFKEVYDIWGGQSESHRSVIDGTHYLTLVYRCNVRRDGYVMGRPIKTYYLDFINGKLESWHCYSH